jgi:phosphotransferase system  glucose/maltose/N-acetylglucosamine-specific IIC component
MGLVSLFGGEATWALVLAALIGAGLLGLFALLTRLPFVIVMVETAIAGAIMTIIGLLLIFQQIDLEQVQWGVPWKFPDDSWFWWIIMIVLATAGIVIQQRSMRDVALPEERWIRADAAARRAAAVSSDAESRR